ncbi:MAG: DAK2 domain-containing protein [Actinobacteria bacterium]|nr:DAK2 domain-containing protein [Actinomycetota bacterium]
MTVTERLGAEELRSAIDAFREALRAHQAVINRLNVYPVPDGDTGTNMALTVDAVAKELAEADPGLDGTCRAIAHGSLMGARGNSGVILSQILRAVAATVRDAGGLDGATLAAALAAASDAAYAAVGKPVEGTILTVVRESAAGAGPVASAGGGLVAVAEAARAAGGEALERTPELLAVLREAGVVDAGGTGFLLLLDALLHVADGRPLPETPAGEGLPDLDAMSTHPDHEGHDVADLRYEVMYLLEAPDSAMSGFKQVWAGIGDSIVVVGGEGLWNCHIHTDDIGAAIEAAIDIGRPCNIRVTDLMEQVEEERWVREQVPEDADALESAPVTTAVVAVATGEGVARLLRSFNVQRIVAGGQTMNPSTADLLQAVESAPARGVVLLPNNKNIVPVAEQVAEHSDKVVRVVPTRSVTEGLAALIAYDPEAPVERNAEEMAEAADGVVAGEVTRAVRDSTCELGPIRQGDWLGLDRDGIRAVEADLAEATCALLAALVDPDHEIVTLLEGEGASPAATRRITEWLAEHHPGVACEVHHGGQPLYPYIFGVE